MAGDPPRRVPTGASRAGRAAVAVAALAAAVGPGLPGGDLGVVLSGLLFFGFLGIAARGDPGGPVERLAEAVERLGAGELDVDLATDRDDEIGRLYAAVDGLAASMRERRRVFDVQRRAFAAERDRLSTLFEHAPGAVAHVELDDRVVVEGVNPRFEALFGRDEAAARGEALGDLGVPPAAVEDLRRQLETDEAAERTVRGETATGPTDLRVRLVPIGEASPPEEGYAVISPVAEREATSEGRPGPDGPPGPRDGAEGEQGSRRSLLDSIFEQVPVHLFVKDREGRHLRVSSAYLGEESSREPEDFIGMTDLEILGGEFGRETHEDDVAVIESGEPLLEKEEYVPSIGEWCLTSKVPWRDEDGEIQGLIGIALEVTERKESRRQLEAIVENTSNPIYIKDRDGAYRLVNDAVAELFDRERSEVVGSTDDELFDPESVAEIRADDERVLETGERVSRDMEVTIDGEEYVFRDDKYPYRDEDGQVVGVVGVSQDVTEHRARERALRETNEQLNETNERLNAVVEASPDALVAIDPEGNVELWNPAAERIFGWSESEVLGEPLPFVPDDRTGESEGLIERLASGESIAGFETVRERRDGSPVDVSLSAAPMRDAAGEMVGLVGVFEDVTDRKAAERQLRERERELRAYKEYTDDVLDAVDDVFYVLDERGQFQRWNESLTDVSGFDDEAIRSMYVTDFVAEADRPALVEALEGVLETGRTRVEADLVTSAGRTIPYEFVAASVETPDGERHVAGIGRDVSEQTERERELRATKERLQKFIEASPVGVVATDPDGTVTLWNEGMERIFGWRAEDVLGEPYPAVPDGAVEDPDSIRQRVLRGESVSQVELQRETIDGELIDVSLSTAPVRDDAGDVAEIVGFVQDISGRKQRERELREEHDRFTSLFENLPNPVVHGVHVDEAPVVVDVNRAFESVFGVDAAEIRGEILDDVIVPEDRREEGTRINRQLLAEGSLSTEIRRQTSDGRRDFILDAVLRNRDADQPEGYSIWTDITERKEREAELERTRDLLQQAGRVAQIGGWEVDLTSEPPEMTWTAELYDIHDVDTRREIDLETTLEFYHPDDREYIREQFRRAVADGEGYDVEVRALTADDEVRWVRAIGEPVVRDGEVVAVRGSVQDVTEGKERELALRSLHEAARGLLGTETETDVAQLVVETAEAVLGVPGVAVYLLDPEANELDPVSHTEAYAALADGAPPVPVGDADSPVWSCFVAESPTVLDGGAPDDAVAGGGVAGCGVASGGAADDGRNGGEEAVAGGPFEDAGGGLLVPIGDHGVLAVVAPSPAVDEGTRRLAETLVATAEAAFDRLESESALRRRDEELAARNRRLRRQVQVTDIIRTVDQSLVGAGGREEIEAAVCRRLVEAEDVAFAWIAGADAGGSEPTPRAWAGANRGYLDAIGLGASGDGIEPALRTARTGEPTVVGNVVEGLNDESWRKAALARRFHSVVAVPLAVDEYFYGVLAVYADEPGAFGDLELTVFGELGENIASSIAAVETRRALHADTLVELTLRLDEADEFLARVARETGARVEYEGLGTTSADETRLFFTAADDVPPEAVAAVLDDLVSASDHRLVAETGAGSLFEATVGGEVLPARLVRHGASPRSLRTSDAGLEAVVDVPATTDVREFVDALQDVYPAVELVGRRDVERATQTRDELTASLLSALTDRQREVLRTAYLAGFFEWPRESTGEEVAEMLDVSQPTVNRHLRLAQGRLLDGLFEAHPSG